MAVGWARGDEFRTKNLQVASSNLAPTTTFVTHRPGLTAGMALAFLGDSESSGKWSAMALIRG
jgi:hypothetical protein